MNAQANRRIWRHEGGAEAVEIIALIAVCIALLAAIGLGFNARGGDLGVAAVGTLTRFTSRQAPDVQPPDIQVPDIQTPDIAVPVIGVPNIVVNPPQTPLPTVPAQLQQGSGNPLMDFWNSLPDWAKGAIISAGVALAVCAIVVALVALGVITALSLPVVLIASAIAIALAAIAGAIYVLWTGQVDVGALALIGISVPLLVFGLVWLGASGTLAAAATWIRTIALPWVRGVLTTVLNWLAQRLSAALTWIRTVALPWMRGVIPNFWKWLHDREAVGAWLKKYGLPLALFSRALEEFVKGSYVEGFLIMLIITLIETLAKGNPAAYLVTFLIYPILKGIYGRYKEDFHKWLERNFPWLPLPKAP